MGLKRRGFAWLAPPVLFLLFLGVLAVDFFGSVMRPAATPASTSKPTVSLAAFSSEGDSAFTRIADSLTRELDAELQQTDSISVLQLTDPGRPESSEAPPGSESPEARFVINGRVRKVPGGDDYQVDLYLIDAGNGETVWSHRQRASQGEPAFAAGIAPPLVEAILTAADQ